MTLARYVATIVGRGLSLFVGAVILADCATDAGGPSFVTIGVGPVSSGGAAGSGGSNPADLCVRLPVLLGSVVEDSVNLSSAVSMKVRADRDGAIVSFPGSGGDASPRSYTLSQIESGVSEVVPVLIDGMSVNMRIASGCTNP